MRQPAVAGTFYPEDKEELQKMLDQFLSFSDQEKITNLHGIIVPHAGYIYSGRVAAKAFKAVPGCFERVIVLGPNHTVYTDEIVGDANESWETPLGKVAVRIPEAFKTAVGPHLREHSLEVQLPFLQKVLGDSFEITPLIVGDISEEEIDRAAMIIDGMLDEKTLLVISTDLSHFHHLDDARIIDKLTIDSIRNLQGPLDACGANPIRVLHHIARKRDWRIHFLEYATSADVTRDPHRVVGYASFWF